MAFTPDQSPMNTHSVEIGVGGGKANPPVSGNYRLFRVRFRSKERSLPIEFCLTTGGGSDFHELLEPFGTSELNFGGQFTEADSLRIMSPQQPQYPVGPLLVTLYYKEIS